MTYEEENEKLDSEIFLLESTIAFLEKQDDCYKNRYNMGELKARLFFLKKRRGQSYLKRTLGDADMHHVHGRIWSINDGCFLWMLIFWAVCALISIPFLLASQ